MLPSYLILRCHLVGYALHLNVGWPRQRKRYDGLFVAGRDYKPLVLPILFGDRDFEKRLSGHRSPIIRKGFTRHFPVLCMGFQNGRSEHR